MIDTTGGGESDDFDSKIEFLIITQSEDFKKNVCIPYFKDIYKVLSSLLSLLGPEQSLR
jgi:hypothetical protein